VSASADLALSTALGATAAAMSTVSPAHRRMIVTAPSLVAGDTVRAAHGCEPSNGVQMSERSRPAREDIILDYV
jgi:hypothetical protein